jgi:hypothetical protein
MRDFIRRVSILLISAAVIIVVLAFVSKLV